jgi:hypothetical protein
MILEKKMLSELAVVTNGKTPSKLEQRDSGHPVLKIRDVDELGLFRGEFQSYVDERLAEKFAQKKVITGDTLILNAAHNADYVGSKTFFCNCEVQGALATGEWLMIRPEQSRLAPRYLFHWVNNRPTRRALRDVVKGIHLYPKDVARLQIPLPPLDEQKRIAAILDAADALRAKRRQSIAQLDALIQSTFLDLFGDPVTNPMGWKSIFVDDVCNLVRGSSPRPQGDARYFGGNVPRLMVADITRDGFKVTPIIDSLTEEGAKKSRPVPKGTIVMAVSGNVGLVATVQVPCCVHDGFVAFLELDRKIFDPTYFMFQFHFLKATHENRKAGAIFQNITTTDIKRMLTALPPLPLQQKFAAIVESIERQKTTQRAHLAELDALFAALQHRAFRGEL